MKVTPARRAEQKIAARWGGNVARLLKERELKMCELGKLLDPDNSNPTGHVFNMVRRHTMPDDATCCKVASFLGVSKEKLHAGELPEMKGPSRSVLRPSSVVETKDEKTKDERTRPRLDSSHFRKDRRAGPEGTLTTKTQRHKGSDADVEEHQGEDELYGFVLDAVRQQAGALIEPERGEFVRKLARLCREYGG